MSPKNRLHANIDSELDQALEDYMELCEKRTGIRPTKTQVLEAVIKEGLEVLKEKLDKNA